MRSLEEHRLKVVELSGREDKLLKDVEEKESRVAELEALLGEVCLSMSIYMCTCHVSTHVVLWVSLLAHVYMYIHVYT